jgi:hypothetical protein
VFYRFRASLVDGHDHEQYRAVEQVFRSGRTCYYQGSFIPTLFDQPDCGWDYNLVNVRDQVYDQMILPVYAERNSKVVKVILENYQPVAQLPGHPKGAEGGTSRYAKLILKAKRLLAPQSGSGGPTRAEPGAAQ